MCVALSQQIGGTSIPFQPTDQEAFVLCAIPCKSGKPKGVRSHHQPRPGRMQGENLLSNTRGRAGKNGSSEVGYMFHGTRRVCGTGALGK